MAAMLALVFVALATIAEAKGAFGTVWAICVDQTMPYGIRNYFRNIAPDYLLVYSTQSQFYYNVWAIRSSAKDISAALSMPAEGYEMIGRWNYIQLMSLLCIGAGLTQLSMPWLEAVVQSNDLWWKGFLHPVA